MGVSDYGVDVAAPVPVVFTQGTKAGMVSYHEWLYLQMKACKIRLTSRPALSKAEGERRT